MIKHISIQEQVRDKISIKRIMFDSNNKLIDYPYNKVYFTITVINLISWL